MAFADHPEADRQPGRDRPHDRRVAPHADVEVVADDRFDHRQRGRIFAPVDGHVVALFGGALLEQLVLDHVLRDGRVRRGPRYPADRYLQRLTFTLCAHDVRRTEDRTAGERGASHKQIAPRLAESALRRLEHGFVSWLKGQGVIAWRPRRRRACRPSRRSHGTLRRGSDSRFPRRAARSAARPGCARCADAEGRRESPP